MNWKHRKKQFWFEAISYQQTMLSIEKLISFKRREGVWRYSFHVLSSSSPTPAEANYFISHQDVKRLSSMKRKLINFNNLWFHVDARRRFFFAFVFIPKRQGMHEHDHKFPRDNKCFLLLRPVWCSRWLIMSTSGVNICRWLTFLASMNIIRVAINVN